MDTARQQEFREKLADISLRLHGDVLTISEQARGAAGGQGAGEISNLPLHHGDMGTDEYLYGLNALLLEHEEYIAHEVRAAFHRLDDRTFGLCEACGREIADERLEAIPYARYCTTCAERLEPIFVENFSPQRAKTESRAQRHPVPPNPDDSPFSDDDDQDSEELTLSDDVQMVDDDEDSRPAKVDLEDFVP
jgi:RNA polymerase-binding transcription factor DksA